MVSDAAARASAALRTGLGEEQGLRRGIVAINRRTGHVAFGQANDLALLEIDGGEDDQGCHSRNRLRKESP